MNSSEWRSLLQRAPKLRRRDANYASKDLREVARVFIAHFEADLDQAARGLTDELLGARDPFARDELERGHPACLFEDTREMKGT